MHKLAIHGSNKGGLSMNKFICATCGKSQYSADPTEDKPCVYCGDKDVKIVKGWNASKWEAKK